MVQLGRPLLITVLVLTEDADATVAVRAPPARVTGGR